MTPSELRAIRLALGLSGGEFGRLLGYRGNSARVMAHQLEAGIKPIMEAQRRLAEAYRDGYRPEDWPKPLPVGQ